MKLPRGHFVVSTRCDANLTFVRIIIGPSRSVDVLRHGLEIAPKPTTMSKEWQQATEEKMRSGFEREAAGPVAINPITRALEKK